MIAIDLKGAEDLVESSERFRKGFTRAVDHSFRRSLRKTATATRKDIAGQSGFGRSVWGQRSEWGRSVKLSKIVGLIRLRIRDEHVEAGLYLRGMAKVIEEGGRVKPHRFGKGVHPGAAVRAHGFGRSNLERDETRILSTLEADVGDHLEKSYGL